MQFVVWQQVGREIGPRSEFDLILTHGPNPQLHLQGRYRRVRILVPTYILPAPGVGLLAAITSLGLRMPPTSVWEPGRSVDGVSMAGEGVCLRADGSGTQLFT